MVGKVAYVDERSVDLVIDHSWNGESWNSYKIFLCDEVDETEIVDKDEYIHRYMVVEMHEGTEAADKWIDDASVKSNRESLETAEAYKIGNQLIGNQLIGKWEAMLTLGLFSPSVTI